MEPRPTSSSTTISGARPPPTLCNETNPRRARRGRTPIVYEEGIPVSGGWCMSGSPPFESLAENRVQTAVPLRSTLELGGRNVTVSAGS